MVVGPICLTVINATILHGFKAGFSAGMGVAVADTVYIFSAGLAIESVAKILKGNWVHYLSIGGVLFLLYLAYKFWRTDVSSDLDGNINLKERSRLGWFVKLFSLTITGPTTIFTYAAVFSNFLNNTYNMPAVIFGAMMATFSFYTILTFLIALLRKKMTVRFINILSKLSSVVIVSFAIMILRVSLKAIFAS